MFKKVFQRKHIEIIIILLLGVTPLLWFDGSKVVLGHDAGLTISPVSHFFDRLNLWTERFGLGTDQTYAVPGFFIHGFEALVGNFVVNLQLFQKIIFSFWFLLPGLTMYYFARKIEKNYNLNFFALPAALLYMFNHFLLQGWFIAERTKFSVYAALPLFISFLFDWEKGKRSTIRTAIYISLTFLILNGEGSPPLFGGVIVCIGVYILYYFIQEISKQRIVELIKLVIGTFCISILLQAYWLFPYITYVLHSYALEVAKAGGESGVLGWISYVSQDSSLINILRLQGIPEWYQNLFHPYANIYLKNPFLVAASFTIPVLAFLPLLLFKDKPKRTAILFFTLIAIVAPIFIAGSHPPFGAFYIFLINNIPGFIAFRTPFYKFAPALWFSYSILIGFTLSFMIEKLREKHVVSSYFVYIAICIGIIFYSFPFLNGSFFDYIAGKRSMRVQMPSYIYDFGKFSDSPERINVRTLTLPPAAGSVDTYTWGYWSLSPLTSLLTNASIVNESGMSTPERNMIEKLYSMMKNNETGWENYAKFLGIRSFLLRNDFAWNTKGSLTSSPSEYKNALSSNSLMLVKKFGQWEVYDFKDTTNVQSEVTVSSQIAYLFGKEINTGIIASFPNFNPREQLYQENKPTKNTSDLLSLARNIYIKPDCVQCNLQFAPIDLTKYTPLFTRGSLLYPAVSFIDKFHLKSKNKNIHKQIIDDAYSSMRGVLTFSKVLEERRDNPVVSATLLDYYTLLAKLNSDIDLYLTSSVLDNDDLIDITNVLNLSKNIFLTKTRDVADIDIITQANNNFMLIGEIEKKIASVMWLTNDEIHKRFLISVPMENTYTLFYRQNDNFVKNVGDIQLTLDGKKITKKIEDTQNVWQNLGNIFLTKGTHKLEILQETNSTYQGPSSLRVESSTQGNCSYLGKIEGMNKEVYRVEFQYKNLSSDQRFFVRVSFTDNLENQIDNRGDRFKNVLSGTYRRDFSIGKDNDKLYLWVCSYPDEQEDSYIEITNPSIKKIAVPEVIFYTAHPLDSTPVRYSSLKHSQTEYKLRVSDTLQNKYVVSLNESYSSSWNLLAENKNHILMNGFANGWIVDKKIDNTAIVYTLQDKFKIGYTVSIASLIILGFGAVVKRRKK